MSGSSSRLLSAKATKAVKYRIAICGAGPAGLAALKNLRRSWHATNPKKRLQIDLFEASLVPGGLLRHGVAPDHGDVKKIGDSLVKALDKIHEENDPLFSFEYYGGAQIGEWLRLSSLRQAYDAVLLTNGPGLKQKAPKLGLPNEWNPGVVSSREMVQLYNGEPLVCPKHLYNLYERVPGVMAEVGQWTMDSHLLDYSLARSTSDTSQDGSLSRRSQMQFGEFLNGSPSRNRNVVIIGQGNVSLDIARIFSKKNLKESFVTREMTESSYELLERLATQPPLNFHIVGRRGALQAAWSTAVLRELSKQPNVALRVRQDELEASVEHPAVNKQLRKDRSSQRMLALLEQAVVSTGDRSMSSGGSVSDSLKPSLSAIDRALSDAPEKSNVWLRFLLSPEKLHANKEDGFKHGWINRLTFVRNDLTFADGRFSAVPSKKLLARETIDEVCLVVKSLGYGGATATTKGRGGLFGWKTGFGMKSSSPDLSGNEDLNAKKAADLDWNRQNAPIFTAGWKGSGGLGDLNLTLQSSEALADEVVKHLVKNCEDRDGDTLSADLLCLRATVPEIGIPLDWDEAMNLLSIERNQSSRIPNWKEAADHCNRYRVLKGGPRNENWQYHVNKLKPKCLHAH